MKRKALVIGNGSYSPGFELTNAINDAVAVAAALRRNGFDVTELRDLNRTGMDDAARAFGASLEREGSAIFYFAGHGIQIEGENYLIAVDADATNEASTKHESLKLAYVIELMDRAGSETNIVILDACRNNPFGGMWHRSAGAGGLAPVTAPRGTLIAFSTSPGEVSHNGLGSHGRYTEALLQHIDAVCPVETMFKRVRATLIASSTKKQTPWEHTSLVAEFFINQSRNVPTTIYSDQAVRDGGFVAHAANPAHIVLCELRSSDWFKQNPAANGLKPADLNRFSANECFMIGRALYSAADGTSKGAEAWIGNFVAKTGGVHVDQRKALLDGMLFEIFFNADGVLRATPKGKCADAAFDLSRYPDFRPSFEFIADLLVGTGRRFHAFPNFDVDVAVDVTTQLEAGATIPAVTGIVVGGRDILQLDDPMYVDEHVVPMYRRITLAALRAKLASDAVIPTLRQVVNFPDLVDHPASVRFPLGYSLAWK
jgi:hypothetical protein